MRDREPSADDLFIGPEGYYVGTSTKHEVNVVAQFCVKRDFDSKQSREPLFKLADPITPIFEVFIGNRIDSAEKRSANTTGMGVCDSRVCVSSNANGREEVDRSFWRRLSGIDSVRRAFRAKNLAMIRPGAPTSNDTAVAEIVVARTSLARSD